MSVIQMFIEQFFEKNPDAHLTVSDVGDRCLENGYVTTKKTINLYVNKLAAIGRLHRRKSRRGWMYSFKRSGLEVAVPPPSRDFRPLRVPPHAVRLSQQPHGAVFERLPQSFSLRDI